MTRLLLPNFLSTDATYEACVGYWRALFDELLREVGGDTSDWSPWLLRHFANGTPFARPDLPVLEARSRLLNRAVRITQHEPEKNASKGGLGVWISDYDGFDETFPEFELNFSVVLDDEVLERLKRLLREWLRPGADVHDLQQAVRDAQR